MSAADAGSMRTHESFFALFGGPLAWFLQLNAGFGLASQPCFHDGERTAVPHFSPDWTWNAMIAATIIAFAVGLLAAVISWRGYVRTQDEQAGDHRHVLEAGSGRTRFLALWGVFLGAGSAITAGLMFVAYFVLPRCGG